MGMEEAMQYAKTYRLDRGESGLMVVEEVRNLRLRGKTIHLGVVIFSVCWSGEMSLVMNGRRICLSQGCLLVNFGDSVVSEVEMSADFSATAIVISQDFLHESMMSLMNLWPYLLFLMEHPVIGLGEAELKRLVMNYEQIVDRLSQTDHYFRREATIASVQACYLDVCDFLHRRAPQNDHLQKRSYGIFDQFVRLVALNYVQHRDVRWYADEMKITPKYLSEVVKEVSGRTSSQWITNFVVTEMKSLLRNTDLSIKEIAVEMNFPNQSFLGKYFKNVVGVSPNDYRNDK